MPIFEERHGQIAVVKYQMSWPGTGDPYYTPEGNGRRGIYSVNSIPYFVRNGAAESYSSFSVDDIDDDLAEDAIVKIELRYMLDPESQSISIRGYAEALDTVKSGAQRMVIAIVEKVTYQNKKSNGETEFHNVFKKMLPESAGDFIIGQVMPGQTFEYDTTYVFQGDYRLPNNAGDPINDNIEHSVESFDSLHVIMFMQSAGTDKTIYQAATGVLSKSIEDFERPWGSWPTSVTDVAVSSDLKIYPNPVNYGMVSVETPNGELINNVRIYSMTGAEVSNQNSASKAKVTMDVTDIATGLYIVKVSTSGGEYTKRVSIIR